VSVAQALATAGGLTEFAGDELIWVRQKASGGTERIHLNVKELVEGEIEGALLMHAGDALYVP
ncbi:MAG TPA: sugar ABC transporter substrate-binding protein, partial [Anaeromyxobacteraceae bacterium]|nr:sugar ABC transporter substrate-binding protein [Anaeromyxobacteraceae bacterium]